MRAPVCIFLLFYILFSSDNVFSATLLRSLPSDTFEYCLNQAQTFMMPLAIKEKSLNLTAYEMIIEGIEHDTDNFGSVLCTIEKRTGKSEISNFFSEE